MGLFPRLYLTFLTGCVIALGVCLYEVNRREKSDAASNAAAATAAHAPQRWFEDSDVRIRALEDDLRVRRAESAPAFGFADTRWKSLVSCAISGARSRTVVILIAGQSNAGNHGGGDPYVARDQVDNFNLNDGLCYHAADPLLGTTAEGANFATRLGDLLIDAGAFDRVILVPIAVGGTTMEEWAGDSPVARRIPIALLRLLLAGLRPDYILWEHGEAAGFEVNDTVAIDSYVTDLRHIVKIFRGGGLEASRGRNPAAASWHSAAGFSFG